VSATPQSNWHPFLLSTKKTFYVGVACFSGVAWVARLLLSG
jgi:hypothetical protein